MLTGQEQLTGIMFQGVSKISENSGFIHWQSRKQNIVELSSCESEYIALEHCVEELLCLQKGICMETAAAQLLRK